MPTITSLSFFLQAQFLPRIRSDGFLKGLNVAISQPGCLMENTEQQPLWQVANKICSMSWSFGLPTPALCQPGPPLYAYGRRLSPNRAHHTVMHTAYHACISEHLADTHPENQLVLWFSSLPHFPSMSHMLSITQHALWVSSVDNRAPS